MDVVVLSVDPHLPFFVTGAGLNWPGWASFLGWLTLCLFLALSRSDLRGGGGRVRFSALPAWGLVPGRCGLLPLRVRAGLRRCQLPAGTGRMPESAVRSRGRVPRSGQQVSGQPVARRRGGCWVVGRRGAGKRGAAAERASFQVPVRLRRHGLRGCTLRAGGAGVRVGALRAQRVLPRGPRELPLPLLARCVCACACAGWWGGRGLRRPGRCARALSGPNSVTATSLSVFPDLQNRLIVVSATRVVERRVKM